jgi:flagellar hook-associated protein 2
MTTTTGTVTSGSVTSLGVGSNLDLSTLLDQLSTAARAPVTALQTQQASCTAKISAYGQLQSALTTFQAVCTSLSDPKFFQTQTASSSNTGVLSATADATAKIGTYNLSVTQLAQAQSLAATGQASSTTAIGSGKITLSWGQITGGTYDDTTGKYSGATFTKDTSQASVDITIDSTNNTLEGIRDAINANSAAGVSASIVNDGSGTPYRLVLTSAKSGDKESLNISVAGDAALQNLLGQDPAGTQNLQQTTAAQSAKLSVNGVAVTSASNKVDSSIPGLTLNLAGTGSSQVTVAQDTSGVTAAINQFVAQYNNLQGIESNLSSYDASSSTGGVLLGDSTLRSIQTRLRDTFNTPQDGTLKVLSNIGISFQKDGTLSLDSTKLASALKSNLSDVAQLWSTSNTSGGYGKKLSSLIDTFVQSQGSLDNAIQGQQTTYKDLGNRITEVNALADQEVANYKQQFTALDVLMSTMTNTSTYLTQQFDAMNNSNGK